MFDRVTGSTGLELDELPPGSDLRRPWASSFEELADEVGPVGRMLAEVPGGPHLLELLREVEGWAGDAGSVVEVVAAYERMASWARARAAAAAARLADRPEMDPAWPDDVGEPADGNAAPTELSLRLGVSRRAAGTLVAMGRALRSVHHRTGDALESGHIDWPRARVVVESLEHVHPLVAQEVEDRVLPGAAGATPAQLRHRIARLLHELDPADAVERHERARERRCVTWPRALPDGMASMTATLTVDAAVRLDACLQAAALAARSDGDSRSVDQLRADALHTMGEVAWTTGAIGWSAAGLPVGGGALGAAGTAAPASPGFAPAESAEPGPAMSGRPAELGPVVPEAPEPPPFLPLTHRKGQRAATSVRVNVTVGYGTLLGLDDRPGELAGFGPVSADVARRLAMDGTWRRLLVDEPSGTVLDVGTTRYVPPADMIELVRERNRTCVIPTCGMPARQCQTDHTVPFPRVDGRPAVAVPPDRDDGCPNTAAPHGDERAGEGRGLSGNGDFDDARCADAGEGTDGGRTQSRRPDPDDGRALVGRPDLDDGRALSGSPDPDDGRATDGDVCRDGRTAVANLGPLCATHHLLKTHGGFRLEQPRPGSFVVRTPSGHVYLQAPDRPPGVPPLPLTGSSLLAEGDPSGGVPPSRLRRKEDGPPPF